MNHKYETIVFDLDGTLLDTSVGIFNSVRFAEKQMGFSPIPDEKLRAFVGPPPKQMYQKMYGVDEGTAIQATKFHRQYSNERAIFEASAYDGMVKTLEQLKAAGCKLAVATLKGETIAEKILKINNLSHYFDAIIGMDKEETRTKCATILLALERTHTAGAALMVGDSEYDAQGAWQAGVDFVGAAYGFGIAQTDTRFPIIQSPIELLQHIS